jgi:hypothetical protein
MEAEESNWLKNSGLIKNLSVFMAAEESNWLKNSGLRRNLNYRYGISRRN